MKIIHIIRIATVAAIFAAPAIMRAQEAPTQVAAKAEANVQPAVQEEAAPSEKKKSAYQRKKTTSYRSSMRNAKIANKDKVFTMKRKAVSKVRRTVFGDPRRSCTHPQHGEYMREQHEKHSGLKISPIGKR